MYHYIFSDVYISFSSILLFIGIESHERIIKKGKEYEGAEYESDYINVVGNSSGGKLRWSSTHAKMYLQVSPMDDYTISICLLKTFLRNTSWGKKMWRRKKSTIFLCSFKCFKIVSFKPCKIKIVWKKNLKNGKEYNLHVSINLLLPLISMHNFNCSR